MSKTVANGPDVIVLVDKPQGVTSHDVVATGRKVFGTRRVGHAGTLDPMATGLLVLGVNKATRLLTYLVGERKSYTATIRLGESRNTDDAEGEVTASATAARLGAVTNTAIYEAIANRLTGEIMQRPSAVSAIKIDGKRAYKRVRGGEDVSIPARAVTIFEFVVGTIDVQQTYIDVEARVSCSAGTYIRALARDLGEILGVGGHLTALRRTEVGPFNVDAATELTRAGGVPAGPAVLTMAQAAAQVFAVHEIDDAATLALRQGKRLPRVEHQEQATFAVLNGKYLVAIAHNGGRHMIADCVFPGTGPSGTGAETE